jgi:hypothetical protein
MTSPLNELAAALVGAQAEFAAIPKTAENPFFHSKYADLATVVMHTQPILAKHGLAVAQFPTTLDGEPALTTWLLHASGQSLKDTMKLCAAKNDPQGQGAAITYARRFSYMAVLGLVADDDDDGNTATRSKQAEPKAKPKTPADLARDKLAALVKRHKLDGKKIGQRFADDYGLSIYDGDAEAVGAFTQVVADEVAIDKAAG